MSQRELAQRAGTTQSAVARIETGAQNPRVDTLRHLLHHAGFELSFGMRRAPEITDKTLAWMRRLEKLSIEGRLSDASQQLAVLKASDKRKRLRHKRGTAMVNHVANAFGIAVPWGTIPEHIPQLRPDRLLRVLHRHHTNPVILGTLAAHVRGFPVLVTRADITVMRTSLYLTRLAAALTELNARIFSPSVPEGLPFEFKLDVLKTFPEWQLVTGAGRVRLILARPGTGAFDDLRRRAEYFTAYGVQFSVASLNDVLDPLEITGRFREHEFAPTLRAMITARELL